MQHPNWSDQIGEDMQLLGPIINFDTDAYVPELRVKVMPGAIQVFTDSGIIDVHKLYVGISGTDPLPFVADFKGKNYSYGRGLAKGVTEEKLDVMLREVHNNVVLGQISPVITIAYLG